MGAIWAGQDEIEKVVSFKQNQAGNLSLKLEDKDGEIKGYHCWVLAFPEGYTYGIDASEAAKHPEKKEYFFGHLDDRRIGITRGRDILLSPPQHGERLNYIYKAYEEVDLEPSNGVETYYFVRELK